MGYFSNGSEGADYQHRYCLNCANSQHTPDDHGMAGCAVWDAHLIYNGEREKEKVLDVLIPRDAEGWNQECKMFRVRRPAS